jgi:hypothetical protein
MLPASVWPADRVDDHIGAVPAGELAHRGDEIAAAIVDAVIETERLQALQLLVARCGCEHRCAGTLRQLDRGDADAAGAGVDQCGLALRSRPNSKRQSVGGAERNRHAGAVFEIDAVRNHPRRRCCHRHQFSMRAARHHRDDALADTRPRDAVADRAHDAGALIADDAAGSPSRRRRGAAVSPPSMLDRLHSISTIPGPQVGSGTSS